MSTDREGNCERPTDELTVDAALARSQARFDAMAEVARDAIFRKDRERRYTYVNPAMEALLGRTAADLLGHTPEEIFPPEAAASIREVDEIALSGRVADAERTLDLGGVEHTFHTIQTPILNDQGEVVEISGIVRDISQRVRSEQRASLQRDDLAWLSERTLELMDLPPDKDLHLHLAERLHERLENAIVAVTAYEEPEGILRARAIVGAGKHLDRALQMIGAREWARLGGHPSAEYLEQLRRGTLQRAGEGIFEVAAGVVPRALCGTIERLFDIHECWVMGFRRAGLLFGSVVILLRAGRPMGDPRVIETYVGNAALALDRRRTESTLRESEERFRQLAEASDEIFFSVNDRGEFTYISPAAERILGSRPEEMLGRPYGDFMDPSDLQRLEPPTWRAEEAQAVANITFRVPTRSGKPVELEISAYPVVRPDGQVVVHGTARDVTEKRRLEEQVLQMQKMEAIGTLAGGVAHDFNNLLTAILGYAEDLKELSEPGDEVHEAATVIEHAGIRAAEFTRQLLGYARRGKFRSVPVDLHEVVQEVIAVLSRTVDPRITLSQRLQARECRVLGDPGQLQQVVMNLGVNAVDAMPEGGTLTFETAVARGRDCVRSGGGSGQADAERCLELRVSDTGVGIDAAVQPRIFEPFFTTKPEGVGTGMGLATVYGIVENHGGTVAVSSAPDRGTTFTVTLPLAEPTADPEAAVQPDQPVRGEGLILVVEDESVVRGLAERMLRRLGYDVLLAENGVEAVRVYEQRGADIDLVLLDVMMPEMSGRECFARLQEIDPDVRVILTSGFSEDEVIADVLAQGVAGFLQKPFALVRLSRAIADVLRARQPD